MLEADSVDPKSWDAVHTQEDLCVPFPVGIYMKRRDTAWYFCLKYLQFLVFICVPLGNSREADFLDYFISKGGTRPEDCQVVITSSWVQNPCVKGKFHVTLCPTVCNKDTIPNRKDCLY